MFSSIDQFIEQWKYEVDGTQKLFDALTDASLKQAISPGGRDIGRLAWHVAQTIPEMMGRTGLHVKGVDEHAPVPSSAAAIASGYKAAAASLVEELKANWNEETLKLSDDMYGDQWTRAQTLMILITHQAHHRGQLTVLMRQAGLPVTGVYGPVKEDWATYGMEPPAI